MAGRMGHRAAMDRLGGHWAIILHGRDVWAGPRDLMGYTRLFMGLLDCPELVTGILEKYVGHYIRVIQRAAGLGVTFVYTGDDVADNRGPLFSLEIWQSIFMPYYRRLGDAIHKAGFYHWKHSDGNMYPLPDSIVEAGFDGIDPIDPMGGMELGVAIRGNVDQVNPELYRVMVETIHQYGRYPLDLDRLASPAADGKAGP